MDLYHSTDAEGISILHPDRGQMRSLLATLDQPESFDKDHPDVSLIHDPSGWSISVFPSGIVVMDNLDAKDRPPAYLKDLKRDEILQLWIELSEGRIDALRARPWHPNC